MRYLDLARNRIGAAGAKALARALKQISGLRWLNLGDNAIGADGARALAPALAALPELRQLYLESNDLGREGVQALVPALQVLTGLVNLCVHDNALGYGDSRGFDLLAPVLERHPGLWLLFKKGFRPRLLGCPPDLPNLEE